MFDYIIGRIDYVCPEYIVLEANGIGYLVMVPNPFVFSASSEGSQKVFVYHHVREDNQAFYGFRSREEKKLFIKLLNVTGIGPKGALAILATGRVDQVVQAIEDEDEKYLIKFPGIGKKTARQIILDLKGKLQDVLSIEDENLHPMFIQAAKVSNNPDLEEAILALQALGYSEKETTKLIPKLEKDLLTTEEYIKKALQSMLM